MQFLYEVEDIHIVYKYWLVRGHDGKWFKTRTIHPKQTK